METPLSTTSFFNSIIKEKPRRFYRKSPPLTTAQGEKGAYTGLSGRKKLYAEWFKKGKVLGLETK